MAERRWRTWLARLRWSLGVSLTSRILAVNIIALGLLAGSLFYLDSYRNRLLAERFQLARAEAEIAAGALGVSNRAQTRAILVRTATQQQLRLRLYGRDGALVADTFALADPTFAFANPAGQPWYLQAARSLDRGTDFLLGAEPIADYTEPKWPKRKPAA
jgi:two-component system, OmpR family, sensor histidine kinase ChvG